MVDIKATTIRLLGTICTMPVLREHMLLRPDYPLAAWFPRRILCLLLDSPPPGRVRTLCSLAQPLVTQVLFICGGIKYFFCNVCNVLIGTGMVCAPGKYFSGSSCVMSPAGNHTICHSEVLRLTYALLSHFFLGLQGAFTPYTSHGSYYPCPPGTYSTTLGASACTMCPVGTYSSLAGATACSSCLISQSTLPGAAMCNGGTRHIISCGCESFSDVDTALAPPAIVLCPAGQYNTGTGCAWVPAGKYRSFKCAQLSLIL